MAESIDLNLSFEGTVPETLHLHFVLSDDLEAIYARLTAMETIMSALSDAVAALAERISVDVAHLQDLLAQKDALLVQSQANDASDAAAIADLTAQNDALNTEIAATVASLQSIDPVADFPVVTPPPVDGNAEPAPVEPPVTPTP